MKINHTAKITSIITTFTMATSIQTCLPGNACKQGSLKSVSKHRRNGSSMKSNSANRKSAVERLEESKANYVKSECVLDSKQQFKNSSHLQVSNGPPLDVLLLKGPLKHLHDAPKCTPRIPSNEKDFKIQGLNSNHSFISQSVLPPKSPGQFRMRAKSQSESLEPQNRKKLTVFRHSSERSDEGLMDLESQLKLLISSSSKENINLASANFATPPKVAPDGTKVRRGYSDPVQKGSWATTRGLQERNCNIHKSMPDLSPSKNEPSQNDDSSSSGSSLSTQDLMELEDKYPCSRTTSDYVSRSSSFRCEYISHQENNFLGSHDEEVTQNCAPHGAISHSSRRDWDMSGVRRRPVTRSKSDVSHRFSKSLDHSQKRSSRSNAELERFFDTMGLDSSVWHHITSPPLPSSPPQFFDSISSINSEDHRSSICSEDSLTDGQKDGLTPKDLRQHGPLETSIVEKNARVIKWLYSCRKAVKESAS